MNRTTTKTSRYVTIASLGIPAILLAYVVFLLVTNYASQRSLQTTLLEQFKLENERHAMGLSAFFTDRRRDLVNLASSREIAVFFENRALGMSMEYGLKQSLPPIKERFRSLIDRNRIDGSTAYARIILLDEQGRLLVDALPPDRGREADAVTDGKALLHPGHRSGAVVPKDEGREILISAAYYFKGAYAGQIVAWIHPGFLYERVLPETRSPNRTSYLITGRDTVALAPGPKNLPDIEGIEPGVPRQFDAEERDGARTPLLALRTPVKDTPFSLLTVAPVREVYGRLEPRGLLVGMAALAFAIIGGAIITVRLSMQSLVLQTRLLDESVRHHAVLEEKNRQLETEINERTQAEDALRRSEERYRTLIETSPDVIYTISARDGALQSLNSAFETFTGWPREQWLGRPFLDLIHPDDRPLAQGAVEEVLRGQSLSRYELRCRTSSGDYRIAEFTSTPLRDSGTVVAKFGIARDITERKKLEDQLRHAVKMQAVGQLAGGIAHDFNNILSVIIGYGNIIETCMKQDDPLRAHVDHILSSAERAAQLTQNLLTFSRKQILNIQAVDVNESIRKAEPFLAQIVGERVLIAVNLVAEPLTVMADSGQIEQILMNLASNARDAMPGGGHLVIATERCEMDREFKRIHGYGKEGTYALITVSDTGVGMDDLTRDRIFEPFFTTKEVGKGTGLGLAMVFGIVKQHYGYIDVWSEQGKGTTLKVYLPLVQAPPAKAASPAPKPERFRGGTETILLAEDRQEVRAIIKMILEGAGYTVVEAVDGADAVAKFKERGNGVQMLVLDVIMPNKNGNEAYEEIKALRPGIKALFVSGYATDILKKSGITGSEAAVISKPVMPGVLLKKIREILDA